MLTDDDKRAAYERYGAEGPQISNGRSYSHGGGHHHGGYYEDDINPEDIFNMFFGGMPPGKCFSIQYSIYTNVPSHGSISGHRMRGQRRTHFQFHTHQNSNQRTEVIICASK